MANMADNKNFPAFIGHIGGATVGGIIGLAIGSPVAAIVASLVFIAAAIIVLRLGNR